MPLNKARGNMYNWCTHTFNVIKGECPHQCSYCYCKRWGKQSPLHFDEKELKTDLGSGNTIFVGSSCDMWAENIPAMWIEDILRHCNEADNRYLFQTKNPERFLDKWIFPPLTMLGVTLETNRRYNSISKAPIPYNRAYALAHVAKPTMISIEPIMDFDLDVMVLWIDAIKPEFVSIGADSGNNHLPEPSAENLKALMNKLQGVTEIRQKNNLARLLWQRSSDRY